MKYRILSSILSWITIQYEESNSATSEQKKGGWGETKYRPEGIVSAGVVLSPLFLLLGSHLPTLEVGSRSMKDSEL